MAGLRAYTNDTPETVRLPDGREVAVPALMTPEEFAEFPWPPGQHWQLIWGIPTMTPAPIPYHQMLVHALHVEFEKWLTDQPGFIILQDEDIQPPGTGHYLRPDLNVLRRRDIDLGKVPLRACPYVVAEVLSPSTAADDWGPKLRAFAQAGIGEYWIADPANGALSVLVLAKDGTYHPQVSDPKGMLESPFFRRRVRLQFDGENYRVVSRAAKT